MTYREHLYKTKDWKKKTLIMEMFHLLQLSRNSKWTLAQTARYFTCSIALVSENLKLAHAIGEGLLGECTSRDSALKVMKGMK